MLDTLPEMPLQLPYKAWGGQKRGACGEEQAKPSAWPSLPDSSSSQLRPLAPVSRP